MTPRQQAFISALFEHSTIRAAAESVGVTDRTGRRWLADPEIIGALREAEAGALDAIQRSLTQLAADAVGALADALTDGDAGAAVKVRAADLILQRLLQFREAVGIEDRLLELEARLNDRQ
jgi:hypothetical protein